jgi:hypothetical protein
MLEVMAIFNNGSFKIMKNPIEVDGEGQKEEQVVYNHTIPYQSALYRV